MNGVNQQRTPRLTFNTIVSFYFICHASIRAAVPVFSETGEQLSAAGPGLCEGGAHVLSQPVVLHQLSVDSSPRHLVLHETSLHHGAQLLLLRHLALQTLRLLTVLHRERVCQLNRG